MIRKTLLLVLFVSLIWLSAPLPLCAEDVTIGDIQDAQGGTKYWGETVFELKLHVPDYMNKGRIRRSIKIIEGRPFTPSRVRRTIERIFLMGDVSDVIVRAKHNDEGQLVVSVRVVPAYTIRSISFLGSSQFNYDDLKRISRISTGTVFDDTELRDYRKAIREAYRDQAYFDVKVHTRVEKDEGEYAVDLFFDIEEGKRYRIDKVMIFGDPGIPEEAVLKKLRWYKGRIAKKKRIDRGVERLERYYRRHGYLEAVVAEPSVIVDSGEKTVTMQIHIQAGDLIGVEFTKPGFSYWERKYKMKRVLSLKSRRRFNKWIMEDWRDKIRQYYQSKGYYEAQVTAEYDEPEEENIKMMTFSVERGEKVKLERVDFTGNEVFTERELRRELDIKDAYVPEQFKDDLTKVIRLYQTNGYLQVKLEGPEEKYDPERRRIVVSVKVDEGPQTLIEKIVFEGNEVFESAELIEKLKFAAGDPLDPWKLERSDTFIIQPYFQNGYIKARVSHNIEYNEDRTSAVVIFTVDEGIQFFFGNVYIRGNVLTKDHVIRRELYIEEDEPFDYEQIVQSEQNLNALGFFKSVRISPVHPDLTDQVVDLICEVTERNAGKIEYGVGYNTADGWMGSFGVSHSNLAGHGRKLTFSNEFSVTDPTFVFDSRKYSVGFIWPWIARIPMNGRIVFGNELAQEISYKKNVYSIAPGVEIPLSKFFRWLKSTRRSKGLIYATRHITLSLDYIFEQNFIYKVDEDAGIDRGFIKIASIAPGIVRDDRDDVYNPTTGSVNGVQVEYSTPPLQSDVHYLKIIGRTSWYFPVFKIVPIKRLVYAIQFRAGHAQSLDSELEVPITERFFLGGSTTMRGFGNDEISPLGPDGETKVGGLAMAHMNHEFRFPIAYGFGGLVFFDMGNVWKDANHLEWEGTRTSAGLGFRYLTPVGPISADYGFKLDREEGESIGEFYITIGNAF